MTLLRLYNAFFTLGYLFWNSEDHVKLHSKTAINIHPCFAPTPRSSSKIYIRKSYRCIRKKEIVTYISKPPNDVVFYITGTPGIGKTRFLYYILCMLRAKAERKPVILTLGSQVIILDNHPRVTQTYEMNHGYVYIHNPDNKQEPVEMSIGNNHYILIASPDPKHTRHVKKLQLEKVIMAMWKWKEISECHTK